MTDETVQSNGNTVKHRDYLPAERQDMILSLLTRQSVATVSELATLLNTTEITVRRDLTVLSNAGLLKRIRGGAMSVGETPTPDRPSNRMASRDNLATNKPPVQSRQSSIELGPEQPAIGIMLPEPSFFWPEVIEHIRNEASRFGLRVITRESVYEADVREDAILEEMASDPTVCGLMVAPNSHPECAAITWDWIGRSEVPLIVLERDEPMIGSNFVDSVRTNHSYGVRKAATHFLERGHTNIGAAFTQTPTSASIEEGWRQILHESTAINCPFIASQIPPYDTTQVNGVVDNILESGVTAVLVHSDYLAIAIAQALERRGKRIPTDISLISIDGFATPSSRPLTVLRSPAKDLASTALHTLLNRIEEPQTATKHIFVDPTLVDRGSVLDLTR
jgi:DNA-binding LacI/PurR family transcriptional regulator